MSIISKGRAPIKPRPAPVAKTTVLYDCGTRVVMCRFGKGVLASKPHHFVPFTVADQEWWSAESNSDEGYDPEPDQDWDAMAWETRAQELVDGGFKL